MEPDATFGSLADPIAAAQHRRRNILFALLLGALVSFALFVVVLFTRTPPGSPADRAAQHYALAIAAIDADDKNTAFIELRNTLAVQPRMADARLRLGELYFEAYQFPAAAKELSRALELGWDDPESETSRMLVEALIRSGDIGHARNQIIGQPPPLTPKWEALLGLAALEERNYEQAHELLSSAWDNLNSTSPSSAALKALHWLAVAQFGLRDLDGSYATINKAISFDDQKAGLWVHLGDVEFARKNLDGAEQAYTQALTLDKTIIGGIYGMARAKLANADYDAARKWVAKLPKNLTDPRSLYIRALLAAQTGNHESAVNLLTQVLDAAPHHADSLYLLAKLKLEAGQYNQALAPLETLLARYPKHLPGHQLRSRVLVAGGQIDEIRNMALMGDATAIVFDPQTAYEFSTELIRQSDYGVANNLLQHLVDRYPNADRVRLQLVHSLLLAGETHKARATLTGLDEKLRKSPIIRALDTLLFLREGNSAEAQVSAEALVAEFPENPLAHTIQATALLSVNQTDAAYLAYERAFALDPGSELAGLALARRSLANKNAGEARSTYNTILTANPGAASAAIGLASIHVANKDKANATRTLTKALTNNADDFRLPLALCKINLLPGMLDAKRAADYFAQAEALARDEPRVLHTKAQLLAITGKKNAAIATYLTILNAHADDLRSWYELAGIYEATGRVKDAERSLQEIIAREPDHRAALFRLGTLAVARNDVENANQLLTKLRQAHPEANETTVLNGNIALRSGDLERALELYRTAYARRPNSKLAIAVHRTESKLHGSSTVLQNWLENNSRDVPAHLALAQDAHAKDETELAAEHYRRVLGLEAQHPVALNNLADVLSAQGNIDAALELAAQAADVYGDNGMILDTYGWLLIQQGYIERGTAVLQKAVSARASDPNIQFHFAAALAKAGERARARDILNELLMREEAFPTRDDALALQKVIGRR